MMRKPLKIGRRGFCASLAAAVLLPKLDLFAQSANVFLPRLYQSPGGATMPYRLFLPKGYKKRNKYPLVLWLHGGAGRGNDNLKQISGGNTSGSYVWTRPENQSKYPCFVVAPQCPEDGFWGTIENTRSTPQLGLVFELLTQLQRTFSVDSQRLYVTGQSLGGFGTWTLISERPGMFAAAVPVCGGGNESEAPKLTKVPIWAFHGEMDQAVSVERSRKMIAAIRLAGGLPKYTEYKGASHVIWDKVFSEPDLLPWVFAQKLKP